MAVLTFFYCFRYHPIFIGMGDLKMILLPISRINHSTILPKFPHFAHDVTLHCKLHHRSEPSVRLSLNTLSSFLLFLYISLSITASHMLTLATNTRATAYSGYYQVPQFECAADFACARCIAQSQTYRPCQILTSPTAREDATCAPTPLDLLTRVVSGTSCITSRASCIFVFVFVIGVACAYMRPVDPSLAYSSIHEVRSAER